MAVASRGLNRGGASDYIIEGIQACTISTTGSCRFAKLASENEWIETKVMGEEPLPGSGSATTAEMVVRQAMIAVNFMVNVDM